MPKDYFVHTSAYIDENVIIGKDSKIWHFCHIMPGAIIGNNCTIGQNVFVASSVIIGDNVKIQNNVSIYSGVTIEDDVFLGPSMVFTNVINPRSHVVRKNEFLTTIVKKGASVGANATIVCGNNIGQYGFIGAGAVVTKSVLDFELIAGVPGKRIGWMSKDGYPLTFKNGIAVCPGTKQKYVLKNNEVKSIE